MADEPPVLPFLPPNWPAMATYKQVAELLDCSQSTLFAFVRQGRFPSPVYIGASARFPRPTVEEMMRGPSPRGTYRPSWSVRRKSGRKGGSARARALRIFRQVNKANAKGKGTK